MYKRVKNDNLMLLHSLFLFLFFSLFVSCVSLPPVPLKNGSSVVPGSQSEFSKPAGPEAYYHAMRAALYESKGKTNKAIEEYHLARSHAPDSLYLLDQLVTLSIRTGNFQAAGTYAEEALRRDPKHIQGLVQLGNAHTITGNSKKAIHFFEMALSSSADDAGTYFGMAGAHARLKQFDRAEELIKKGITLDSDNPFGFYYLGRLMLDKKEYGNAIDAFKQAIAVQPYFEVGYINLGYAYELKGDLDAARDVYQTLVADVGSNSREALGAMVALLIKQKAYDDALNLLEDWALKDPHNVDVRLRIGLIHAEQKQYGKAIQAVSLGINRRPSDLRLRFYRASLFDQNKEFDQAKKEYEAILAIAPSNVDGRLRLASLYYYRLNQPGPAVELAEEAMVINPRRPEPYLVLGLLYFQMEEYEKASNVFKEGIQVESDHTEIRFHLGATYDKLHRFDDMVTEMKEVIRLNSKHANALNYLGYSYADKGIHLQEALDLIERALKIKSEDGYFIDSLGWVYFRMGKLEPALEELKRAISFVPDDPVIHEHMGEVYLDLKMEKEAQQAWIRSLEIDPKNKKLAERFRSEGFGEPNSIESIRLAVEKAASSSEAAHNEDSIPVGTSH